MKSNELFLLAERFAPIRYSEEFCSRYGAYDNSGLLVDFGNDVKKAVFSLDLSCGAVEYAEKIGAGGDRNASSRDLCETFFDSCGRSVKRRGACRGTGGDIRDFDAS